MKPIPTIFWKQSMHILLLLLFSISIIAQVPSISSYSPASGPVGTTVTITGTNFSAVPANNIVYFGAVKAIASAATSTSVTVTVPAGTTYQPITVTTGNLKAYSDKPFMVTFCSGSISTASFATKADFATGTGPNDVSLGDFDGDGKADLAVTNKNDNTVSVLRNTGISGTISFATRVNFATGTSPMGVCISDIDADGKLDIIVTNTANNTVSVLRNTSSLGVISFAAKIDLATAFNPLGLAINDLDGDGKADIAVANYYANSISILRNTSTVGTISFDTKVDFAS
ncbi:MAG: VCBS repeat-containing protein, partial [Ferruginibacter sp.]